MGSGPRPPSRRRDTRGEALRRHGESSWFAWMFEEFLRYLYGTGILALALLVPLQMASWWLPVGQPPIVAPGVVAGLAIAFVAAALYFAFLLYRYLWSPGAYVDRLLARRQGR